VGVRRCLHHQPALRRAGAAEVEALAAPAVPRVALRNCRMNNKGFLLNDSLKESNKLVGILM